MDRCKPHNPKSIQSYEKHHIKRDHTQRNLGKTTTSDKHMIHWLVDTESPRRFIILEKAEKIIKNNPKLILQSYNSQTQYRCFNNNNIKVEGTLQLNLQSGSWKAQNSQVLVLGPKTNNLMRRDIFQKLVISLQQCSKQSPVNHINSLSSIETEKIIKRILKKYPQLSTRLQKSKIHITKSIFQRTHIPNQKKTEEYLPTYSKKWKSS